MTIHYLICYDIADDERRDDIATLLSGYGPRVQLSVFECEVATRTAAAELRGKLRALIDPVEDQVRMYLLGDRAPHRLVVIGARTIEERQDFWIIT